jgi:DNA-binding NarL/FixJ family response regulator
MQTILIVDDHPLFRAAMRDIVDRVCAQKGGDVSYREASSFEEAFVIASMNPDLDLVMLDICMPDSGDLSGLLRFRAELPAVPVVVVSAIDDPHTVSRALLCGAAGFIPKSASVEGIAAALKVVLEGGIYTPDGAASGPATSLRYDSTQPGNETGLALTPRQAAVLAKLAEGKSNKQIARELSISDMTVKVHVTAILRSLDVASRAQAIVAIRGERLPEVNRSVPDRAHTPSWRAAWPARWA